MKLAPQSKPYTPRQLMRLVGVALKSLDWLTPAQFEDGMAANGAPELLVTIADPTGPNGMRSFIISVREV